MKDSYLKSWLTKKGYFKPNGTTLRYTHLCLDNAKLYIPPDSIPEFYHTIIQGLNIHKDRYFICEHPYLSSKNTVRRFYIDFDFKCDRKIELFEMKKVIQECSDIVLEYFGLEFDVILCQRRSLESGELFRSGFHAIWPDFTLSEEMSVSFSTIIKDRLKEKFNEYDWETVIDYNVYRTGLRMIYMKKIVWKKIDGQKKRVVEDQQYKPVYKYPEDDYLDGNHYKYMMDCSIQCKLPSMEFSPIKPIMLLGESKTDQELIKEISIAAEIRTFIQKHLPRQWDEEIIKVIPRRSWYIIQTKSRYCANIDGEHNSENIYFKIKTNGFVQRCHCKCDTLERRKNGLCKHFESKRYKLSERLFKVLFPDKVQAKKDKMNIEKDPNLFMNNSMLHNNKKDYLKMSLRTLENIRNKC